MLSFDKNSRRQIGRAHKNADKIINAVTTLPAMTALVREMYELIEEVVEVLGPSDCECPEREEHPCIICKSESLVERMEE